MGPGGWTTQAEVVRLVPEMRDTSDIAWLAKHSYSQNNGPRLQTRWAEEEWEVRATPRLGAETTPWQRGARADDEGKRLRGPRSQEAIKRRQEALTLRRKQAW